MKFCQNACHFFVSFFMASELSTNQITHLTLLAYMDFMTINGLIVVNISNNMADITAVSIVNACDTFAFKDEGLSVHLQPVAWICLF